MDSLSPQMSIPAVCRIPGHGTAFLVATGVLMTTTAVVPNAREAARMTAVFFEGTKKPAVEVRLQPDRLFFAAAYPEHVNYCLVACDTAGIFNVMPIKVPLLASEWPSPLEGDTLLLMQHWGAGANGLAGVAGGATARFEEVLRRRDDLLFLKVNSGLSCAGCPAFDANSQLVGVMSQTDSLGDGPTSRVLSIATIVKHLFANAMCGKLQQSPPAEAVWESWYVPGDTTRIISIMANFKGREVLALAVRRLCEHTAKPELLEGVVACGGTSVIIASLAQFKEEEALARAALRSLWDISFGDVNNRPHIAEAGGVETILDVLELHPSNQEIAEFGTVVLFNLTLESAMVEEEWAPRCVRAALAAMRAFPAEDALQKFATGLLLNLVRRLPSVARLVTSSEGSVAHINGLIANKSRNALLMEQIAPLLAALAKEEWASPALAPCVPHIIALMVEHSGSSAILLSGNNALWSLGALAANRIAILQHPHGPAALAASVHTLLGTVR